MSNFSQDQGNWESASKKWACAARSGCKEIKDCASRRLLREQVILKIDADIAEKCHLWMETN
jgi:hypothetical protein